MSAFESWPRTRRETPTPEPDIAAEVSGDMARTMAGLALTFAIAACLPLAHITWAPTAAFIVSAVWVAGLWAHDRKKANR